MSTDRFEVVANDLRQQSGVIECVAWSDSVSVRYSGVLCDLRRRARTHDLVPVTIDGVLYAEPVPVENADDEIVPDDDPAPTAVVAEADGVQSAHMMEDNGRPRLLVTTTGVKSAIDFMELNGPYGWILTEAKEAQIRFAPPKDGVSFLLSRDTSQLQRLDQK
ncbi:hypothetical protein [Halorubrum trueperi]|uniref:Uncharacterized protein n=1 Tax=Halorubrum trueperi TaxID=2004704 RepID=A0ABD5UGA8_9EURY